VQAVFESGSLVLCFVICCIVQASLLMNFDVLQVAMNPDNTVFDAKRLIGRRYDDPSVQSDMKHWPFNIDNDGGKPKIRVDYKSESKTFFPEEISSMVLVKMKEIAEAYLGKVLMSFSSIICP